MSEQFSHQAGGARRRAAAWPFEMFRLSLLILAPATAGLAAGSAGDFKAAMADAMARMHLRMDVPYSGDPDRDFVVMMIPHHEAAVDMAKAQLMHGKDERLRRLAQGIIVEQQQEIEAMRQALARLPHTTGSAKKMSHEEVGR